MIAIRLTLVSRCLNSDGLMVEPELSTVASCDDVQSEQSDDEEFLSSMEVELDRLIDRLWQEPNVSDATDTGDLLNGEPETSSEIGSSDRASKRRKV